MLLLDGKSSFHFPHHEGRSVKKRSGVLRVDADVDDMAVDVDNTGADGDGGEACFIGDGEDVAGRSAGYGGCAAGCSAGRSVGRGNGLRYAYFVFLLLFCFFSLHCNDHLPVLSPCSPVISVCDSNVLCCSLFFYLFLFVLSTDHSYPD